MEKRHTQAKGLGLLLIIIGSIGVLFAVGDLIVRVTATFLCFFLINYGFRLQGMPPIQKLLSQFISYKWFK